MAEQSADPRMVHIVVGDPGHTDDHKWLVAAWSTETAAEEHAEACRRAAESLRDLLDFFAFDDVLWHESPESRMQVRGALRKCAAADPRWQESDDGESVGSLVDGARRAYYTTRAVPLDAVQRFGVDVADNDCDDETRIAREFLRRGREFYESARKGVSRGEQGALEFHGGLVMARLLQKARDTVLKDKDCDGRGAEPVATRTWTAAPDPGPAWMRMAGNGVAETATVHVCDNGAEVLIPDVKGRTPLATLLERGAMFCNVVERPPAAPKEEEPENGA